MIIFLLMGVLIFVSVIFYVESENFENILIGIWWVLVIMMIVGYGDKVLKLEVGYIIGCVCVICGVLIVVFMVLIVVNNFVFYYVYVQLRIKLLVYKCKEFKRKLYVKNKKLLDFVNKWKNVCKKELIEFMEMNVIKSLRVLLCGEELLMDKMLNFSVVNVVYFYYNILKNNFNLIDNKSICVVIILDGVNIMSLLLFIILIEIDLSEIEVFILVVIGCQIDS